MSVKASVGRWLSLGAISAAAVVVAGGAMGATIVVPSGPSSTVVILDGDGLDNFGDITGSSPLPGVFDSGNATSIINEGSASIAGDAGVMVVGATDRLINLGTISGTGGIAVQLSGHVGSFQSSGSIAGTTYGVELDDGVDSFIASGSISSTGSSGENAVFVDGPTGTFASTATISTQSGTGHAIYFNGNVGSFSNGGSIDGNQMGALFGGDIDSFHNFSAGNLLGEGASGVSFSGQVGLFDNAGSIVATGNQGDGGSFAGPVTQFDNFGEIASSNGDGVSFSDTVETFNNHLGGSISATNGLGIYLGDGFDTFVNRGTVEGATEAIEVDGDSGRFTNFGLIRTTGNAASAAVNFNDAVESFDNLGEIDGGPGSAATFNDTIGAFSNAGKMWSSDKDAIDFNDDVKSFANSGSIWTSSDVYVGVNFGGGGSLESISNTGTITGGDGIDVSFASVGRIFNSGTVTGTSPSGFGSGYYLSRSTVDVFVNAAGGSIVGAATGVDGSGTHTWIKSLTNAGYIRGDSFAGVAIEGETAAGTTFDNSGVIEGDTGVLYYADAAGKEQLTNSGTIRSLSGGDAINFACSCGNFDRADTLTILTGSKIFGTIVFGSDSNDIHDTLDFSGFAGNTVLKVPGLDMVVPGTRGYVWDQANTQIAIFDLSGLGGSALGDDWNSIGRSMFEAARNDMQDWSGLSGPGTPAPLGFAPTAPETSAQRATETAVMTELDTTQHLGAHGWAGVIGGGSAGPNALDRLSLYGGIVAGSHARLSSMLTLGGMGGLVQATSSSLNGDEVLNSTTGSVGLYGSAQFGVADVDFSMLAGLSGNQSNRKVVAGGTTETAMGNFLSGTISPMLAVSVPVLSLDGTTVSLTASGSYTAGLVAGYTETGSSMNLTVGSQTIQVLDARVGFASTSLIATADGATYALTAKAGVFATSNFGSASVPVTVLGQTTQLNTPGSTAYGVYTGVGVEGAITETLHVGLTLDGSWRSDTVGSASAKVTVGGVF